MLSENDSTGLTIEEMWSVSYETISANCSRHIEMENADCYYIVDSYRML